PYAISGEAVRQRGRLTDLINQKAGSSDYKTAYRSVIEEVAYTWFNRLIAIRFMEVNDYLPSHIRALSSESSTKLEPDLVTTPFDAELELSGYEQAEIIRMKNENLVDDLFRMLFVKQCNALNSVLPKLFEKTADFTELLLNVSVTDQDGVVYHLVHDIPENDFNISKIGEDGKPTGQVEIIGWLYQYYNTEQNELVYDGTYSKNKIQKELLPAATTIYTPDWAVRYMVENSLGRLWLEGHPNADLKAGWKYYLDEAEQEVDVQAQLDKIREEYKKLKPEDIKVIDPCMGSGHILVYVFDVLMQIYESAGYTQREAAKSILENNVYGLDIDDRAFQLAYFAVMMKARQYNRQILNGKTTCHLYAIQESNTVNRLQLKYFGSGLNDLERNDAMNQITGLLDTFTDAKEYGSILDVDTCNWDLLCRFTAKTNDNGQMSMDSIG
ncbi:MAG: BREX-1 system adenine-specific DNA-methyltransferase PglX, partial [Gammaproteobacteria bacterium]|nr:BREX-1 system adenine-specific DNA-methyltransferase PglX [Gammaproteobacteria bacterium]